MENWYALSTKSNFENIANTGLTRKAIEVFLPKILVKSKRRDRRVVLNVPLFPGYLFVKTDLKPEKHIAIVKTAGAVRLVGNGKGPIPIDSECIDSLKIMTMGKDPITVGKGLAKGDKIIVVHGPFQGISGIFYQYKGKRKVKVNIEVLGHFASVEVDEEDIMPV